MQPIDSPYDPISDAVDKVMMTVNATSLLKFRSERMAVETTLRMTALTGTRYRGEIFRRCFENGSPSSRLDIH